MDPCKSKNHNSATSRSFGNGSSSHQHSPTQQSHQRGHRCNATSSINGYSSHSSISSYSSGKRSSQQAHHEFSTYTQDRQSYIPMREYLNSSAMYTVDHGGLGASLGASQGGSRCHLSGGQPFGNQAKRHRGDDGLSVDGLPCTPHDDTLVELARENLLLKRQLHVASLEVRGAAWSRSSCETIPASRAKRCRRSVAPARNTGSRKHAILRPIAAIALQAPPVACCRRTARARAINAMKFVQHENRA